MLKINQNLKKKIFHFSIDDVFESLIEITDKKIPIKKHWFFKILYNLWKKYKIKTGLYVFYRGKINNKVRTLKEVRNISKELKEGWLFFGPHALDFDTPPYSQNTSDQKKFINNTYNEIIRFAGKNFLCEYLRFHYYSESFELSNFLKKKKIHGLFTTDRKVGTHKIPKEIGKQLLIKGFLFYNNLKFIRTDFRVEFLVNRKKSTIVKKFNSILKKKNFIILYSHEYEFKKKQTLITLNKIMKTLVCDLKLNNITP
jgi:hypothetical protein